MYSPVITLLNNLYDYFIICNPSISITLQGTQIMFNFKEKYEYFMFTVFRQKL